ncbi:MAG: NADH-quinone oxidoreductase subunit C [Planctomycetes bacterium]|nr:NADH-quinone oxidoreductase subunit C [Planctomycetota bacterium]
MNFDAIATRVQAAFPAVQATRSANGQERLLVPAAELEPVARFLRDQRELAFDALMDLTAYDLLKFPGTPASDAIRVVLLLHSLAQRHKVTLWVDAPRSACAVPSVGAIWPAAIYFEREVFDLYGVDFAGHPSLTRILCPEDWSGHALRKDYVYPAEYHGVAHLREGQRFESGPTRATPSSTGRAHG